jgi:hypothetical protein
MAGLLCCKSRVEHLAFSLSQVMSWRCMVSMERNLVDHLVSVYVHVDLVQANSDVQEILGAANSTRPGPCSV